MVVGSWFSVSMVQRAEFTTGTLVTLIVVCFLVTLVSNQLGLVVVPLLFMGPRFWRWYRRMLR